MTVTSITPTPGSSPLSGLQNNFQQRRNAFDELAQALQSGNLTQAQQAFSLLTQSAPNSGQAQNGLLKDDFNSLAQALQSGDLDGARKAFATIQQDLQKLGQRTTTITIIVPRKIRRVPVQRRVAVLTRVAVEPKLAAQISASLLEKIGPAPHSIRIIESKYRTGIDR
jgi:hypothetical protein